MEKKKMGRPTQNPKIHRLEIRLSDSENDMLNECAKITQKSKSNVVIDSIEMLYKKVKK